VGGKIVGPIAIIGKKDQPASSSWQEKVKLCSRIHRLCVETPLVILILMHETS